MPTRINKYLAERGYCSRREADKLIRGGKVHVNGKRAELGMMVSDADRVEVIGVPWKEAMPEKTVIVLNKPEGYITTTDRRKPDNVLELVKTKERFFPVGRLDVASSGLLLLTNDGELANRLMHPKFEHEKEYEVETDRPLSEKHLDALRSGIRLPDGKTLPAKVKRQGSRRFTITLREGRNRQIRRMCRALGYGVKRLRRVRVGNVRLGSLRPGQWRKLTSEEMKRLRALH